MTETIFKEGAIVECVNDIFTNDKIEEGRRYKVGSIDTIQGKEQAMLKKLDKRDGSTLKGFTYILFAPDRFDKAGYYNGTDERTKIFEARDDPVKGTKERDSPEKEKIQVGVPGQTYSAKKRKGSNYGYTMRIDSALKLILNNDGWLSTQTMKFDGMTDSTRNLEEDFTVMNDEDREFFRDRIDTDSYHARVFPEDNRIEITNYASTVYAFKHPDFVVRR